MVNLIKKKSWLVKLFEPLRYCEKFKYFMTVVRKKKNSRNIYIG